MTKPEFSYSLEVDLADQATRRQIRLLGVAIENLLDAHDYPESLSMIADGDASEHRYFTAGSILAPAGFDPELKLTRTGEGYDFHANLVQPHRWTTTVIGNEVSARYVSIPSLNVLHVGRTFTPKIGIDGVARIRKPGDRQLRASTAIGTVAKATEGLSREFSVVRWLK